MEKITKGENVLYAVAVEHEASLCPLTQKGPSMALTLGDNLERANLVGVFSMKTHRGIALVEAESSEDLARVCGQLLPHHLPPKVSPVSANSLLREVYRNPDLLEADDGSRYEVLALASILFPDKDFYATISRGLPTLSLRSLPGYLRANAPSRRLVAV